MEVREGYKQTEIGIIPKNWSVEKMGDIGQSIIGLTYSPSAVKEYGTLVLRSSNVQNNKLAFKDNVFVDMDIPERVITKENDILICVRNGSKRLIGKAALIDAKTAGSAFGAFMSVYRSDTRKFMFHQFQSSIIQKQINEVLGATINQITNKDLNNFIVAIPPKDEQKVIAKALSDVDALIDSLEQLIEKKRHLKQGAMEELLTGKRRLPGFEVKRGYKQTEIGKIPEDWKIRKLEFLADILTGFPFPSNAYAGSGIRLLRGFNIKRGNIEWSEEGTKYWLKIDSSLEKYILEEGDIVVAMDGSLVGKSFAVLSKNDVPSLLVQRIARIKALKYSQKYLKEWICSDFFTKHCDTVKTVTAIPHISPQNIRDYMILIPPTINEQNEIANTLSDMDNEIEVLEKKLVKTKQIKEGMMNELLRGRVRLV